MIRIKVQKQDLTVLETEALIAGSVGINLVQFDFSEEWSGLEITAVFRRNGLKVAAVLEDGICEVPREILAERTTGARKLKPKEYDWDTNIPAGKSVNTVYVGVSGTDGGGRTIPSRWAELGQVESGANLEGNINTEEALMAQYEKMITEMKKLLDAASAAAENAQTYAEAAEKAYTLIQNYAADAQAAAEAAQAAETNAQAYASAALENAQASESFATSAQEDKETSGSYAEAAQTAAEVAQTALEQAQAILEQIQSETETET